MKQNILGTRNIFWRVKAVRTLISFVLFIRCQICRSVTDFVQSNYFALRVPAAHKSAEPIIQVGKNPLFPLIGILHIRRVQ